MPDDSDVLFFGNTAGRSPPRHRAGRRRRARHRLRLGTARGCVRPPPHPAPARAAATRQPRQPAARLSTRGRAPSTALITYRQEPG
jgi:hypothetical protein